jgi:outer membrane protein OmpA-like peptidoglycan-associated protein
MNKTSRMSEMNIKRSIPLLVCFGLIFLVAGCGTKSTLVLLQDPEGNVGQVVMMTEGGQQVLTEADQSVQTRGRKAPPGEVTKLSADEIKFIFAEALAAQPLMPAKFILYFLNDSIELTRKSRTALPQILHTIQDRSSTDIVVSGHTDTVGTTDYNYKLSSDRARAVYKILVAKGVVPANITSTSHGKGNPLIKTGDNVPEPRNRRVEVVIR